MRKILSWVLLAAFSLNTFAASGNLSMLEKHIDDFTYATTVESDGSDLAVYDGQVAKLLVALKELQDKGLTQTDVIALLEKKVQNQKTLEALRLKVELLGSASTEEELKAIFADGKDLYARGANWNGTVLAIGGVGLIIIAIAAYKFWWNSNYECVEWREEYQCHDSRCESAGSGDNEYTVCHGQTCGYFNECARHEKKEK